MSEQIAKNCLFAMKADLERLGCKVAIFQHADVDMFEVTIVYPVDVPPPHQPRKWTPEELELQKARLKSVDDVVGDDDDDDDYDDEEES